MTTLPPRLIGLMTSQHGLVTRAQARDHGVEPRHLLRGGAWVAVRTGVYADGEAWQRLDPYAGRPLLRVRAGLMVMQRTCVVSHDSAALAHGLPLLDPASSLVNVTRPGLTKAFVKAGIKYHYAPYLGEQVVEVAGLRALDPARTTADLAREHGFAAGVVAADAALRAGVPRATLAAAYESMRSWPGVTDVRAAVEFAHPGAESPLESLCRILVTELGVGEVDPQFPVRTARGTVWCDLRVGNHVFEADGKQKYLDVARGGLRSVDPGEHLWDEKQRERLIRDAGLGVSRVFWADHWGPRRAEAVERLRRDVAETVSLRGPELAVHLAAAAADIRRETPRVVVRRVG